MDEKLEKLQKEVDTYINELTYASITKLNMGQLNNKLFHDISNIILCYYEDIDTTKNSELSIDLRYDKVDITGYFKVYNNFIHIEKTHERDQL